MNTPENGSLQTVKRSPFFIGYLPVPTGLRLFLLGVAAFVVGAFAALAMVIGTSHDDPGQAAFHFDWGPQTLIGVLQAKPYPVLYVVKGSERIPAGRAVLLAGEGKTGVETRAAALDGKMVQLKGIALRRGDLDGLQVFGGDEDFIATQLEAPAIENKALGRWKLAGEICDGKCLAGAMLPGRGISHRGCANLCLIGGAPPVFVSSAPINGSSFLLLADKNGEPLPSRSLDFVALYISVEGELERRGPLTVFKIDSTTIEVL